MRGKKFALIHGGSLELDARNFYIFLRLAHQKFPEHNGERVRWQKKSLTLMYISAGEDETNKIAGALYWMLVVTWHFAEVVKFCVLFSSLA